MDAGYSASPGSLGWFWRSSPDAAPLPERFPLPAALRRDLDDPGRSCGRSGPKVEAHLVAVGGAEAVVVTDGVASR